MDELDKGLAIALRGREAERALLAFDRCMKTWGMTMPEVDALVLDFGLGDFRNRGLIEHWLANEIEAGYCGKYLFVFDGQTCPTHHHGKKHETFHLVRGRVRMVLDGSSFLVEPGDTIPVPPGTRHGFTGVGDALLLELSTPCLIDDNHFEDPAIPIGRGAGQG